MAIDHGTMPMSVESLPISRFKATCLAAIERVRKTGRPLLITKRGVPIAQVVPAPAQSQEGNAFGSLSGTAEELGDIVEPLLESDWETLR